MCALCGILGGEEHWTDSARTMPGAKGETRSQERQRRVRLANRVLTHYGLSLSDWGGHAYLLKSKTGRSTLVNHLSEMWAEAESLGKGVCDPLEPALLAAMHDAT